MAYNALNERAPLAPNTGEYDLKSAALAFIRDTCTDLKFSEEIAKREAETGTFEGSSLHANEIPYNMEMDINRLCLEKQLSHFLDTGTAESAMPVYLCFMEMFIGNYNDVRQMVELLSEFENNGSSLLLKHRDHYSHSVYVFSLGLAIYQTNAVYRKAFSDFYGLKNEQEAAHMFLEYWGMTSLFHDIGYPFELPFEQVASYFEVHRDKRDDKPFMAYHRMEDFISLSLPMKRRLAKIYTKEQKTFETSSELFAYELEKKLGKTYAFSKEFMEDILKKKPTQPELFNNFMDHAFFSATVVFNRIYDELGKELSPIGIDAMTAILLHNSLYKFSVAYYKNPKLNIPFDMNLHPLAFLMMLCDELQCWDRTAYGRNSKNDLQPMDVRMRFKNNGIQACFLYDVDEKEKYEDYLLSYKKWELEKPKEIPGDRFFDQRVKLWKKSRPKLKECSNMIKKPGSDTCAYQEDIESIVNLSNLPLTVEMQWAEYVPSRKSVYISRSNFVHLYNFAVALNGRYMLSTEWRKAKRKNCQLSFLKDHISDFEKAFENLSLEYQLSNINQARSFAKYLNTIGCFYSDRPVDYPILKSFTVRDLKKIGPLEHERWVKEHEEMGWKYGTPENKAERENKRIHPDMIPYKELSIEEIRKDTEPFELMLGLIKLYDGLRIYKV